MFVEKEKVTSVRLRQSRVQKPRSVNKCNGADWGIIVYSDRFFKRRFFDTLKVYLVPIQYLITKKYEQHSVIVQIPPTCH